MDLDKAITQIAQLIHPNLYTGSNEDRHKESEPATIEVAKANAYDTAMNLAMSLSTHTIDTLQKFANAQIEMQAIQEEIINGSELTTVGSGNLGKHHFLILKVIKLEPATSNRKHFLILKMLDGDGNLLYVRRWILSKDFSFSEAITKAMSCVVSFAQGSL